MFDKPDLSKNKQGLASEHAHIKSGGAASGLCVSIAFKNSSEKQTFTMASVNNWFSNSDVRIHSTLLVLKLMLSKCCLYVQPSVPCALQTDVLLSYSLSLCILYCLVAPHKRLDLISRYQLTVALNIPHVTKKNYTFYISLELCTHNSPSWPNPEKSFILLRNVIFSLFFPIWFPYLYIYTPFR